jgi:hypothetical protein
VIPELHQTADVRYPASVTTGFLGAPLRVEVMEECGMHTLLVATHAGHAKYVSESLRSGAPMRASITARKGTRRWYGYVDSITETVDENSAPMTNVIGVGLTYPLKNPANNVVGKVLDAERRLIRSAGLVPIVRGPQVDTNVMIAGRSKWAVLAETAQAYSQYLFTTGTTVHVLQMKDIIELYQQEAVTLIWAGAARAQPFYLRNFKIPQTDNTGALGVVEDHRIGYGVDPHTARVTMLEEGESMFARYPGYIAQSYGTVVSRMSGSTVTHVATAEGPGLIGVTAGKPIFIRGTDPGPWWLVNSVCHTYDLKENDYSMSLGLHRSVDLARLSTDVFAPKRNILRVGDNGESVHLENDPILHVPDTPVRGQHSWKEAARWRAQR